MLHRLWLVQLSPHILRYCIRHFHCASAVECTLIPAINTWPTLGRHSVNSWSIVNPLMCIDQHSMACVQKLVISLSLPVCGMTGCVDKLSFVLWGWEKPYQIFVTYPKTAILHPVYKRFRSSHASSLQTVFVCFSFFRLSWASALGQCWTQRLTLMRYVFLQLLYGFTTGYPAVGCLGTPCRAVL